MTIFNAAAVLAMITSPACGNVPASSDLAPHLVAIAMTESGGDQYAIGVNADPARGLPAGKATATTAGEATEKAAALRAQGRRIDLGPMQISDRQLAHHHLTVASAFDECADVRAGAEHLADDHTWALAHRIYNCGVPDCGVAYAVRVMAKVGAVAVVNSPTPAVVPLDILSRPARVGRNLLATQE